MVWTWILQIHCRSALALAFDLETWFKVTGYLSTQRHFERVKIEPDLAKAIKRKYAHDK